MIGRLARRLAQLARVPLFAQSTILAAGMVCGWSMWAAAGQQRPPTGGGAAVAAIPIDQDDIAGVVTSARGPEARLGDRRNHGYADPTSQDRGHR